MEADLELNIRKVGSIPVIDLSGDLDTYTCGKLREAILNLLGNAETRLIIRMAKVNYIDSSGLGTLVGGLRRVSEQNGALAISGASEQLRKVFSITGLNKVFSLFEDDEQAARSLKR